VACEIMIAGLQQNNSFRVIFHAQCHVATALESIWAMELLTSEAPGFLRHGLVALSNGD
jgi:hypothetical protein